MSNLVSSFLNSLSFRKTPTSILLIVVYATIFIGVLVSDPVQDIPLDTLGLDLDEAFRDLHQIAARPHAFNSHANDVVRAHILSRLQSISNGFSHIQIADDLVSNATWVSATHGVSFEGNNILVKIEGTEPEFRNAGGVLFSAHFDSVSTAPGVTDDGIGIATLLQMVKYLTTHRTRRTAIFNINNGEEDGLNGAHVFFQHPWSRIPDTFLNLEGASAGGRPLLFRATSAAPVLSFRNKDVSHPHGNVLSADAFARGVISSGTDFSVYMLGLGSGTGMEGMDLAFYQGRSKYHTKYDSIPGANGGKQSLWAMMESVRGAGMSLLNDDKTHVGDGEAKGPVYFDVFGTAFLVFTQQSLYIFNIVMLVVGPLVLLVLHHLPRLHNPDIKPSTNAPATGVARIRIFLSNGRHRTDGALPPPSSWARFKEMRWTKLQWWKSTWARTRSVGWTRRSWRWGKFWLAFILGLLLQVILVLTFLSANPFIVYSQPFMVLVSNLTLAYLTIIFVLHLPFSPGGPRFPDQQKLTMLLQTYILSWILLLIGTIVLKGLQIGGVYFLSAWNIFMFLGCVVASVERIFMKRNVRSSKAKLVVEDEDGHPLSDPLEAQQGGTSSGAIPSQEERPPDTAKPTSRVTTKPDERTPLMTVPRRRNSLYYEEVSGAVGWWILQILLVIPIPTILFSHILILFMAALNQTLADGSSPVIVYGGAAMFSFLIVLPLAPFSFKIHRWVTSVILLIFFVTTVYNWAAFPFSQDAPLKVFFQQKVLVNLTSPANQVIQTLTTLTGVTNYIEGSIVAHLPSSWSTQVACSPFPPRRAMCAWETNLLPSPISLNGTTSVQWLSMNATRVSPTSALISVKGTNTRSCRIYFDNRNIASFDVYENVANGEAVPSSRPRQEVYPVPPEGLNSLWLWSRTRDERTTVEVGWKEDGSSLGLSGRVACEYAEYESGTAGSETNSSGTIPAFEEVLIYLPKWSAASKLSDGLVEVWGTFTV
ncbi:hypothetical protein B0H34DRAFT_796364 [Crassisporium funariophilum]|nr:hypothetical protein B0H34DRAFT_796364 [Crassisporium funariophilum]